MAQFQFNCFRPSFTRESSGMSHLFNKRVVYDEEADCLQMVLLRKQFARVTDGVREASDGISGCSVPLNR